MMYPSAYVAFQLARNDMPAMFRIKIVKGITATEESILRMASLLPLTDEKENIRERH